MQDLIYPKRCLYRQLDKCWLVMLEISVLSRCEEAREVREWYLYGFLFLVLRTDLLISLFVQFEVTKGPVTGNWLALQRGHELKKLVLDVFC